MIVLFFQFFFFFNFQVYQVLPLFSYKPKPTPLQRASQYFLNISLTADKDIPLKTTQKDQISKWR